MRTILEFWTPMKVCSNFRVLENVCVDCFLILLFILGEIKPAKVGPGVETKAEDTKR